MLRHIHRVVHLIVFGVVVAAGGCLASNALETWMTDALPVLQNLTLLDITLPGTHDSMTWDLSTTVADRANDMPADLAWLFHDFHNFAGIGGFIREQARSQRLNVTEQLNAGIRFLDFRVTYTGSPSNSSSDAQHWYSLHLVQSLHRAMDYLQEARGWLVAHPSEILVIWISHHGNECSTDFETQPVHQQHFFDAVVDLFGPQLFTGGRLNETTIGELVARGQQVVLYVSEYRNMTGGGSKYAIDGCQIDNLTGDGSSDPAASQQFLIDTFQTAADRRAADKAENKLFLLSMAGGAPRVQIVSRLLLTYLPFNESGLRADCAGAYHIPNMTSWCPPTLMDSTQIANYYNQLPLYWTVANGSDQFQLPGAIYIDAVAENGTITTGVSELHQHFSYGYVDTVVLFNLLTPGGCAGPAPLPACGALVSNAQARLAQFPLQLWDDAVHGRHVHWPER